MIDPSDVHLRFRAPPGLTRRDFLRVGGVGLAGAALGCGGEDPLAPTVTQQLGQLAARPADVPSDPFPPGVHTIGIPDARDARVYVPPGHDARVPAPFVVLFHGSGGEADDWRGAYPHADRLGVVLLVVQSRGNTWDLLSTGYGVDVAGVDRALATAFARCAVDPARMCFGGFSDGGSYALSLGLSNAALVRRVTGFSPGFEAGLEQDPKPRVFISHGTGDTILRIDVTSRPIVAQLREEGYDVTYVEFDGGHEVPAEVGRAAFDWMVA